MTSSQGIAPDIVAEDEEFIERAAPFVRATLSGTGRFVRGDSVAYRTRTNPCFRIRASRAAQRARQGR
jgi:hypothetical protein